MGKKTTKCHSCDANITKTQCSLQCSECGKWFHKSCTKLSSKEYEVFADKNARQKWVCFECHQNTSSESESTDDIIPEKERRQSRRTLQDPSNREMLQIITKKFEDLEESVKFTSSIMDDMKKSFQEIVNENLKLKKEQQVMKNKIKDLEKRLVLVEKKAETEEVSKRKCNVVLVGLTQKESLNVDVKKVFDKLDPNLKEDDYNILPVSKKTQNSPVIVKFNRVELVERVMELRKSKRNLTTKECGIDEEARSIYLNEDLPKVVRELYKKARELKHENFKYIWCKKGQIYARKDDGEEAVKIKSMEQINLLRQNC